MTIREFEPTSASTSHNKPTSDPLLNNSVLARTSKPSMTRVSRWLTWVLAGLLAAAALLAAGYWGYQQAQPSPLFAPASASAGQATSSADAAGEKSR